MLNSVLTRREGKEGKQGAATKRPKVQKGQVTKMLGLYIYIYRKRPSTLDWRLQDPVTGRG